MEKRLTEEEVNDLIERAKSGDNVAWESLYHNFENYVHKRAWQYLKKLTIPAERAKEIEEELYQAGWQGFLSSIHAYDPEKGKFLSYATHYIDGEMRKEIDFALNPMRQTEREKSGTGEGKYRKFQRSSVDTDLSKVLIQMARERFLESRLSLEKAQNNEKYSPERRVLQIMKILHMLSDEEHSLSKEELGNCLRLYRLAKYQNGTPLESPNTLTSTIENMLLEVNPLIYNDENDREYKVKYEGYQEDRLKAKQNKEKGKKAKNITGFSYVHIFERAELDMLIQLVCFSDLLSREDKQNLVDKLVSTASTYYRTPFQDGEKLKFNPKAIHGRFSGRKLSENRDFSEKINLIQQAIKNLWQIRFKFNCYTAEHEIVPKTEYMHELSPYHLVVYHDHYYCIGLKKGDERIWHYRVDLMSDVEILTDSEGKPVPIDVCAFDGLPIGNASWDPGKYMAEHLYMAYDEPKEIRIKIRDDDYTILHDWFGDHYEKTEEPCETGYDIVAVRTSPSMIVHWAMQYAGVVEVMDEEIRGKIRDEVRGLAERYG